MFRRAGSALLAALIAAGCGSGVGSPSIAGPAVQPSQPTTASAAPGGPSVIPSPSPTVGAKASTGPSPSVPASVPPLGETATITDPDLAIQLPDRWHELSIAQLRELIDQQSAVAPKPAKAAYATLRDQIDAGQVRVSATGPSGFDPWSATLVIEITDAASVDQQIARNDDLQVAFGQPRSQERSDVVLPIGPAVRIDTIADPPAGSQGVPARGIDYVLKLRDGRILWLTATAPAASTTFEEMIGATMATLSER